MTFRTLSFLFSLLFIFLLPTAANASVGIAVVDLDSKQLLYTENASVPCNPGYLVSLFALNTGMDFLPEKRIAVSNAFKGLAVDIIKNKDYSQSLILTEQENEFVSAMNNATLADGLSHSHFVSSSLSADDAQVTTAQDLVQLTSSLLTRHPELLSAVTAADNEGANGNRLGQFYISQYLDRWNGIYITENPLSNDQTRTLIIAITGAEDAQALQQTAMQADKKGNLDFTTLLLFRKHMVITELPVYKSQQKLKLCAPADIYVTIPTSDSKANLPETFTIELSYQGPLVAPVQAHTVIGEISVRLNNTELRHFPAEAAQSVPVGSFLTRFADSLRLSVERSELMKKDF